MKISVVKSYIENYSHTSLYIKFFDETEPRKIGFDIMCDSKIKERIFYKDILTVIKKKEYLLFVFEGAKISFLPLYKRRKYTKYLPNNGPAPDIKRTFEIVFSNGYYLIRYNHNQFYKYILKSYTDCFRSDIITYDSENIYFKTSRCFKISDITGYNFTEDILIIEIHHNLILHLPLVTEKKEKFIYITTPEMPIPYNYIPEISDINKAKANVIFKSLPIKDTRFYPHKHALEIKFKKTDLFFEIQYEVIKKIESDGSIIKIHRKDSPCYYEIHPDESYIQLKIKVDIFDVLSQPFFNEKKPEVKKIKKEKYTYTRFTPDSAITLYTFLFLQSVQFEFLNKYNVSILKCRNTHFYIDKTKYNYESVTGLGYANDCIIIEIASDLIILIDKYNNVTLQ